MLTEDEIGTYGMDDSRMPMSGMAAYTPGMEITGGSLGHGLGIAVGVGLALQAKKNPAFVYNMMSDGELGEGSTWEAAMAASHHCLGNLICLVDFNNQQADGHSKDMMSSEPVDQKFEAFGWHAQRVDGNDIKALTKAFDAAKTLKDDRPRVIICDTKMCKGVPFLEEREITHFVRVAPEEWASAIAHLDGEAPA